MFSDSGPSDHHASFRPVLTVAGYPLYLIQILVLVQVVAMICTTFLGQGGWQSLAFSSVAVLQQGWIWQMVTYPLFEWPSIWWVICMLIIFFTGPEVEKYIGRWQLLALYAGMILVASLAMLLWALIGGVPVGYSGSLGVMFGVFAAFATLYPNVQFNAMFFSITLKVAVLILLGVNVMISIAGGDAPGAVALLVISAFAYLYLTRVIGVRGGSNWLSTWWEERRLRKEAQRRNIRVMRERRVNQNIDQILDKISREGISSLSPEERAALEAARSHLIKRDEKSG
ncbi:MAG: rhomboid family intramembrane serine protease [Verrucomicrobiota bacterium]